MAVVENFVVLSVDPAVTLIFVDVSILLSCNTFPCAADSAFVVDVDVRTFSTVVADPDAGMVTVFVFTAVT